MKTILLNTPDGKHAEWNEQGLLQLVDDEQPKGIRQRVKTFDDAMAELGRMSCINDKAYKILDDYERMLDDRKHQYADDIIAYAQLRIITYALNEGWEPKLKKDEERWYPYFTLWTAKELKNKDDEWKDKNQLMLWSVNNNDESDCGVSWIGLTRSWVSEVNDNSHLVYKSKELATYAMQTFTSIFVRYELGEAGRKAKPWREFEAEKKNHSNDERE